MDTPRLSVRCPITITKHCGWVYWQVATIYRLSSNSIIALKGFLYHGIFNPMDPTLNQLRKGTGEGGFRLSMYLQANAIYVLVVTSIVPDQTGSFSIDATGPNRINASRIGKSDFICNSVSFWEHCKQSVTSMSTMHRSERCLTIEIDELVFFTQKDSTSRFELNS